jgi:small GTP-binding protein
LQTCTTQQWKILSEKKIEVDGQRCEVEILDTLSVGYRWDNEQYIKNADGFILVYSILNKSTFEELRAKWIQIRKVKGEDGIPMVLVGNKCDLEDGKRAVEIKEGLRLADEFRANFFETSAKSIINVDQVFIDLVKQMTNYAEERFPVNCLPLQ